MFAMFFGALIGWERQTKNKSAGIRTHILVSMGSALFILSPILLDINNQDPNTWVNFSRRNMGSSRIGNSCWLWSMATWFNWHGLGFSRTTTD
jgi:uncharacterized membrane protein YhiD involved in acid resistance